MIGGLIKAVGAGRQAKRLQGMADAINPVRPEYNIPEEVRLQLENAYNMAQGDMPGYGRSMDQARGSTANSVAQATNFADSGNNMLQFLAGATERERSNVGNINVQNQQFRQGNQNVLNQALLGMGEYQDQKWKLNEFDPYQQEEFDKRNFQGAALDQKMAATNAWGEFADGVVNTGMAIAGGPMGAGGASMFSKMFGNKPKEQTAPTGGYRADFKTYRPSGF
jgi:hypothetical protein